jgi:hypothetical protein
LRGKIVDKYKYDQWKDQHKAEVEDEERETYKYAVRVLWNAAQAFKKHTLTLLSIERAFIVGIRVMV